MSSERAPVTGEDEKKVDSLVSGFDGIAIKERVDGDPTPSPSPSPSLSPPSPRSSLHRSQPQTILLSSSEVIEKEGCGGNGGRGDDDGEIKIVNSDGTRDEWVQASKEMIKGLMAASAKGDVDEVNLLLSQSANADTRGGEEDGNTTPLHLASEGGYREVVLQLLHHGADVLAKDLNGHCALDVAREKGHSDVVAVLEANAREGYSQDKNDPPLHTASAIGDLSRVEELIEAGAFVNAYNNKGFSALELALENDHVVVVALLRSKGARELSELVEAGAYNSRGFSTLEQALEKNPIVAGLVTHLLLV